MVFFQVAALPRSVVADPAYGCRIVVVAVFKAFVEDDVGKSDGRRQANQKCEEQFFHSDSNLEQKYEKSRPNRLGC